LARDNGVADLSPDGFVSRRTRQLSLDPLLSNYRKAGCIEVVHDVVKNELGGGVLPCAAFGANAAWFRLCLLTYNLLSAMKVLVLPPPFEDARPKRLRFAVFNLPARLVSHAQAAGPCRPESSGTRRFACRPGATARRPRPRGLNAHLVPVSRLTPRAAYVLGLPTDGG
jgi:hypothetical protein